jgi:hypothetical protein
MARLRDGEKNQKENQVQQTLYEHDFGIREAEMAERIETVALVATGTP